MKDNFSLCISQRVRKAKSSLFIDTDGSIIYSGLISTSAFLLPCCTLLYFVRACYLVFAVSLVVSALALSSALNNLCCNATPGVALNLLLLAVSPCSINKLRETMDRLSIIPQLLHIRSDRKAYISLFVLLKGMFCNCSAFQFFTFPSPVAFFYFPTFTPCC